MFFSRYIKIVLPIFKAVGYTVILSYFTQITFVTNFIIHSSLTIKILWFRVLRFSFLVSHNRRFSKILYTFFASISFFPFENL